MLRALSIAVIIVLAFRPKWVFKGIRDDEDAGVTARAGLADSGLARAIDIWRIGTQHPKARTGVGDDA